MLFEDTGMCKLLRGIVARFTADPMLQEDLMQECLFRLWRLERDEPDRTSSWYLQNCRFHLQHCLAAGRSVDSLKRANGDKRVPIDEDGDDLAAHGYHTNGELFELVVARDIVSTLSRHLTPNERSVLGGLAHGLLLQEIAAHLNVSYPTALKLRRKIAALTVRLGVSDPVQRERFNARVALRINGLRSGDGTGRVAGNERGKALPTLSPARRTVGGCPMDGRKASTENESNTQGGSRINGDHLAKKGGRIGERHESRTITAHLGISGKNASHYRQLSV